MRKIITILCLLLACVAHGQIRIVDTAGAKISGSAATTRSMNTTGASLIVIMIPQYDGVTFGTLTDSKSNTWTSLGVARVLSTVALYVYYCANPTVGSGHTFTYTKSGSYCDIMVAALGNTVTSSPIDQTNNSFTASGTSSQAGSITPGYNNEMVLIGTVTSNVGTVSINSGYSTAVSIPFTSSVNQGGYMAFANQTAASATNPTFSGTVSGPWASYILSINWKPNGGFGFFILTQ